jgi:hypothetical protein
MQASIGTGGLSSRAGFSGVWSMKITQIPIDQLELDMENPRIARMLEMYDRAQLSDDQIALALGAGDTTEGGETFTTFRSLKEAIRVHGGLIQAIIVNKQADGRMVVIEGNTRLKIYREFDEGKVDDRDWSTISAVVHDRLPEGAIASIRLQAHLVGPRPWEPYSKAKYLDHLRNSRHLTMEQIIEFCGGKRRQIDDYIAAYEDMEKHYRPLLDSNTDFDTSRFSAFVELQRPNVIAAILAEHSKKDFSQWVIDGLLSPLSTVRQLPRILKNKDAKKVFLANGAQEAVRILETEPSDRSLLNATLAELASHLSHKVSTLPFENFKKLKENADSDEYSCLYDAKTNLNDLFQLLSEES